MDTRKNRRLLAMGLGTVLGAGLLATAALPGSAQVIFRSQYSYSQDYDQDGIPNWRDPEPRIPNGVRSRVLGRRDVYVRPYDTDIRPYDPYADPYYYGPGYDRDMDGVPDFADRDRDGDGVPDRRDRHPNNPRKW